MTLVGFASTDGGCRHYRCELPARSLKLHADVDVIVGGDVAVNPFVPQKIGIYVGDEDFIEPDVIVIAGGYPVGLGPETITAARVAGQRVIVDVDDWPWLPPSNPRYHPEAAQQKIHAMCAANAVTVSTLALLDLCAERDIDAVLIPNTIDTERYRFERAANVNRRDPEVLERLDAADCPIVVGYRGLLAGFHDEDLRAVGPLPTEGFRYVHVGADPRSPVSFADLTGVPAALVEERAAVTFEEYGPALAGVDVALCPLAARPFSKAKSGIAPLEWHAAGVPWIGSEHPEYRAIGNGAGIMHSAKAWARHLELLRPAWTRQELFDAQAGQPEPTGPTWAQVILSTLARAT